MNRFQVKLTRYFTISIWALAAFFIACSQDKPSDKKQAVPGKEIVADVYDGDTFRMSSGKKVRIVGIDTPETGERFHDEAKDYLARLIINKEVTLKPLAAGKDRYQRTLAQVFVDTMDIGLTMIREGYAQLYLFSDDNFLKERYLPVLKAAISQKKGLWGVQPPKPEAYYLTVKGSYRFHRPLCPSLKNANPKNLKKVNTRLEALENGLSPCRNCHP
jgi:micrococcal nuclease